MITGFHHTSVTVADMDRSLAFYRDLLGMEVVNEREINPRLPGSSYEDRLPARG
jgi:catechol 2,3-dioxygenase-like lactoylglutathione lyase family enzyme